MRLFFQSNFRKTSILFAFLLSTLNILKAQTTTYSVAGTTTWTVPSCVTSITVQTFGGGGGGGGAIAIVRNSGDGEACSGGGGGGGGGYSSSVLAVIPGQVYTIVVGSGGIAGISGAGTWNGGPTTPAGAGGTGGTSSFSGNTYNVQATGGVGGSGSSAWNNSMPPDVNAVGAGGTGGVGSGGTTNFTGGLGRAGYILNLSTDKSGAGGGAAGPGGNGGNGTLGSAVGIANPPGGIGQAPGGNGGDGRMNNIPSNYNAVPFNGNTFGGGAGGALVHKEGYNVISRAGGVGAVGAVMVSYSAPVSPGITSVSSPTITCSSSTVQSAITYTNGATTFTWTGPSIVSGSNTGTVSVNAPGVYSYTATVGGCSSTGTVQVQSNTAYPSVTATAPTTLNCTNTTVQAIATTTTTPVTYNWTGPNITGGANTASATVGAPGTYNYSVTAAGGCVTTGTLAIVQNTSVVTASTSATNSLNCTTNSAQVIATTTVSPVSYNWSGTGITSGAGTATINVNQGGTFNYTITNTSNGCKIIGSQAINQNTVLPNPTASASGSITCSTSTVSLNGGPAALTYTWSGPGFSGGTNSQNAVANSAGSYTLAVTGTNGCTNTTVTTVGTNTTLPSPTATSPNSITCTTSTVALNGGPAALTYTWSGPGFSGGSNSQNAVANAAGSYTLSVTGANGCTNTTVTSVGTNTIAPAATASLATAITCTSTTATLQGGPLSGVTYSWTGAGLTGATNQATATITSPGTYTLTTTSTANGCTNTAVVTPTVNLTQPQVSVVPDLTINCVTPTATLSGSSTTPGVTYAWTGPTVGAPAGSTPTNSTSVVSAGGNYTLTVTNTVNACTSTGVVAVTSNVSIPNISVGSSQTVTCLNATAMLTGSSSTSGVNYSWNPGGSTPTNSTTVVSLGGTYTLTVTNPVNSCTASAVISVSQNTTVPTAAAAGGTLTCANTSTTLAGGPLSGVTYAWTGTGLSGATNLANATATATGSYTLTTTSTANGCTNTAVATVTNNIATPTANAGVTQTIVCGVSSVTLTGSGTPVGSTATWLGGVTSPNSFTTTVGAPGTYTLVVTHPTSGCTSTSTVAVSSSTNVPQATVNAITNSITCTNTVVAIGVTLSNMDPVSYTWTGPGISGTNNTATTTATVAGTYSVTITNTVSNCQSTFNVSVPSNTAVVSASVAASPSITCNTTTMTLAATPTGTNYAYTWSGPGTITNGTTANPTVNQGGNYIVTITNNTNGCVGSYTATLQTNTVSPTLNLTPSSLTTTCANPTATLSATSSADPSSTYVWTVPSTGSLSNTTINNPVATGSGVFTVQVTNIVSGCVSSTGTVNITADANVPTLNATASNSLICSNQTTTLSITGADTYTWSTTANTNTITVNPTTTTTYSVTGTNTLTGCSNITNVTVSVTPTPTINVSASSTTICEGNTTTLTLTGATNYTVTNPSQTTTNTIVLTPTVQTTYTITGELQGCASTTETITIDVNTLPNVSASNATSCAGSPVTLTANGADTYTWSTTVTTNTITVSPTTNTTYTVTGTNTVTGCTSTVTAVDVTVNQLPSVTASANPNTTCTSGTISLTASTTATSYTWTTGNGVDNTNQNQSTITFPASTLMPGTYTYTVSVTDVNGCVSPQATTTVSVIDVPNANFDLSDLVICQNENGIITINTPQSNVTYDWSIDGQTIPNTNPLTVPSTVTGAAGTYTVSVLASLGTCTNAAANTLTVNALPSIALVNPTTSACENTSAQLDIAGPNSAYTYNWTNGSNTATGVNLTVNPLTQATQGTYTVTVTDANGCTNRTTGKIDIIMCETFVPEFFSPNGDGTNDGFVIKNIENYLNNQLKIFNRWGNLVYQKDGYLNEFVGFANVGDAAGKEKLPAGTYYVILVYGDEKTETYNGYLLLQY